MSTTDVQKAFEKYEEKVRVPADQFQRAKEAQQEFRAHMKTAMGLYLVRSFLSGSYARHVQTAPKLKDVDIIFVLADLDGDFEASARSALAHLAAAADLCPLISGVDEIGCRAVKLGVVGEEFTIDAVAALEDRFGNLRLARFDQKAGHDDWSPADPKGQLDAHWDKQVATGRMYIPAVRVVKTWNQQNYWAGGRLLPSYFVEAVLFHTLASRVDYAAATLAFSQNMVVCLENPRPCVRCPGHESEFVDEKLNTDGQDRRANALQVARDALHEAQRATSAATVGEALRAWGNVFGPAFPPPSTSAGAMRTALGTNNIRPSGAGIAVGAGPGPAIAVGRSWRSE